MSLMDIQSDRYVELKNLYANQDMAACFAHLHFKMETEVDNIKKDVATLKSQVSDLEQFANTTEASIKSIHETTVPALKELISDEEGERLKLDVWGRKWNHVIRGIEGDAREPGRKTLEKVTSFFRETLKVPKKILDNMNFAACHRLPGGPDKKKNIIVRFVNLLDRDDVMSLAMKLPTGSGYSISPDLPPKIAEVRHHLLKKRSEMSPEDKKQCQIVYLKDYPFVAIRPKTK